MSMTSRPMTSSSVKAIMQKRITVPQDAVGKRVKMQIQGDGTIIDVKRTDGTLVTSTVPGYEGTVLQKKVFNVRANSAVAMSNERTRQFLIEGLAAEKAGETEKASELFNQYLNATQISFGVLLPSAMVNRLYNNQEISGRIELVTTDNGSLLTIDPSTISVVEAETFGTTVFNLDDFIKAEETAATPAEGAAQPVAEALKQA